MALRNCPECQSEVSNQAYTCQRCGYPLKAYKKPKSKSLAVLFAILLGGIGVHKFYLNQPGRGMLYLFFCWTFIPAVISFFEAITYLSMNEQYWDERFN